MLSRRLPLRLKLIAAVLIPLAVIGVFAIQTISSSRAEAEIADQQFDQLTQLQAVDVFAEAIAEERQIINNSINNGTELRRTRIEVDEAFAELTAPALGLDEQILSQVTDVYTQLVALRETLGNSVSAIRNSLSDELANGTDDRAGSVSLAVLSLNTLVLDTLNAQQINTDSIISADTEAALTTVALAQRTSEDFVIEGQIFARVAALPTSDISADVVTTVNTTISNADRSLQLLREVGRSEDAAFIDSFLSSDEWVNYREIRSAFLDMQPNRALDVELSTVLRDRFVAVAALDDLEEAALEQLASQAEDLQASSNQRALTATLFSLGLFVIVGGLVLALYRGITRPLSRLERRANEIANVELPHIVQVMRDQGDLATVPDIEPIEVQVEDEIGKLTNAFNGLHTTAVQLAGEQAASRAVVANMFVNLGRRNQKLLMRVLETLSQLEADEEDPERLEQLYSVDHLATRMRRNAESLLVLAGAQTTRRFDRPVAIADIVRNAMSEVTGFDRVDLDIATNPLIKPEHVADLGHLAAELIENALIFSPKASRVEIATRFSRNGLVLAISDDGLGMTEAELVSANAKILSAGNADETPSRFLGLFVVGRLAARHGMEVELLEAVPAGVVARVRIGNEMLSTPAEDGNGDEPVAMISAVEPDVVGTRELTQPVVSEEATVATFPSTIAPSVPGVEVETPEPAAIPSALAPSAPVAIPSALTPVAPVASSLAADLPARRAAAAALLAPEPVAPEPIEPEPNAPALETHEQAPERTAPIPVLAQQPAGQPTAPQSEAPGKLVARRRTPGANLPASIPDTAATLDEALTLRPNADAVASSLSGLQQGVARAQQLTTTNNEETR